MKEKLKQTYLYKIYVSTKRRISMSLSFLKFFLRKAYYGRKMIVLLMTPEHGNLGDHAIAKAELDFLKQYFPDHHVEQFSSVFIRNNESYMRKIYKLLSDKDTVLVHGGGFLGTIWYDSEEKTFRNILMHNRDKNITVFPQTVYYEDNDWGKEEFEKSKDIYNKNSNLKICVREKKSYDNVKEAYRKVFLIPDMVMSLPVQNKQLTRSGVVLSLRNDKEKTMSSDVHDKVIDWCREQFDNNIVYSDMVVDHQISIDDRERELNIQFEKFSSAQLVITDRLHGMIFAALTETPCIVLNSKSHKVLGCYEWIKNLDYIKIARSCDEIADLYKDLQNCTCKYNNSDILKYYDCLAGIIAGNE